MRYKTFDVDSMDGTQRHIVIETAPDTFTSFPALADNAAYESFLESQSLTDAEVQAMEPDIWHDMA